VKQDGEIVMPQEERKLMTLVSAPEQEPQPNRPGRHWITLLVALLIVAGVFAGSLVPRIKARAALKTETAEMAVPVVSIVHPQTSGATQEIVLPGNVQPFITSPIFARTNGYLRKWYVDIGGRVHKGELLAEIETPEVDQQLRQSLSNLATAEANLRLAEITKDRYAGLLKTNAVAQQDVDNAVGTYNANKAIVEANQANVKQLETLQSFEKVYAPFDGIVTARNTDIGDLINSGSSGGPQTDLFHISQPGVLRVFVNVPQDYSQAAKAGLTADLVLPEFPGRRFHGKLVRTSESISANTRTLLAEVDVDNPEGTLLTGAYAEVHLKLPVSTAYYIIPVNALLFRKEGLRIATVENDKVTLVPITPGHDFGDRIEVVSGLKGSESVVVNPPDSIVNGQQVRIAQSSALGSI